MSHEDRYAVLETCAQGVVIPRFADVGMMWTLSSSGAVISWGVTPVTSAGGQYRLCWCGGLRAGQPWSNANKRLACSTAEDFRMDAGRLTLIGAAPLAQDRTCVSGQTCSLDGIFGHHISSTDIVSVSDTCGDASMIPRFQGGGFTRGRSE